MMRCCNYKGTDRLIKDLGAQTDGKKTKNDAIPKVINENIVAEMEQKKS